MSELVLNFAISMINGGLCLLIFLLLFVLVVRYYEKRKAADLDD
jgi:F0F1-type ATP synthase assembly protein I